jgi:hypothetical protein
MCLTTLVDLCVEYSLSQYDISRFCKLVKHLNSIIGIDNCLDIYNILFAHSKKWRHRDTFISICVCFMRENGADFMKNHPAAPLPCLWLHEILPQKENKVIDEERRLYIEEWHKSVTCKIDLNEKQNCLRHLDKPNYVFDLREEMVDSEYCVKNIENGGVALARVIIRAARIFRFGLKYVSAIRRAELKRVCELAALNHERLIELDVMLSSARTDIAKCLAMFLPRQNSTLVLLRRLDECWPTHRAMVNDRNALLNRVVQLQRSNSFDQLDAMANVFTTNPGKLGEVCDFGKLTLTCLRNLSQTLPQLELISTALTVKESLKSSKRKKR